MSFTNKGNRTFLFRTGLAMLSIALCISFAVSLIYAPFFSVRASGAKTESTQFVAKGNTGVDIDRTGSTTFILLRDLTDVTVGYFRTCFKNPESQIKVSRNNAELTDSDLVGTDCTVECVASASPSTVYETAKAVVFTDVDGDGDFDENDIDALSDKIVMGIDGLIVDGTAYAKAADSNEDGYIDGFDLAVGDCVASQNKEFINFTKVNYNEFTTNFPNTDRYLYRVGNGNTVKLGSLFSVSVAGDSAVVSNDVNIEVYAVNPDTTVYGSGTNLVSGSTAKCVYTRNASDWTQSTLKFTGEGPVRVVICEKDGKEYTLNLEVVNANNATAATGATSANIVLLNDVTANSLSVNGNHTFYGNGFTIDASNSNASNHTSIVTLSNGTLNNVRVIGPNYNNAAVYWRDDNYIHVVSATGTSYIYNSYIAYGRAPLAVNDLNGGTLTVENSTLDGGRYSNMFIKSGNIVLHNVTTINQPRTTKNGNTRVGYGIVVSDDASGVSIKATGYLRQYNWLGKTTDKNYCVGDNSDSTSNNVMSSLFTKMYDTASSYTVSYNGDTYVNTGILCLNSAVPTVTGEAVADYGYKTVSVLSTSGWVMTPDGSTEFNASESLKYRTQTDYQSSEQIPTMPVLTWNYPSTYIDGAITLSYESGGSVSFDPNILTAVKYGISTPLNVSVSMNGTDYTGSTISFNSAGTYTVVYSVTDPYNYNHAAEASQRTITRTLKVVVSEIIATIHAPEFTFYNTGGTSLGSRTVDINGLHYVMPDVTATSDYVKSVTVNGQTVYCPVVTVSFKDNSSDFNYVSPIFKGVNIKNYTNESGASTTYTSSTNISALPSASNGKLEWMTAWSENGKQMEASYKYDSSRGGLCAYSAAMGSNQAAHAKAIQFKFTAGNGEIYYYYIYFSAAQHNVPSCVAEGTLVTMADGTKKPVEQIKQGDMVMTWSLWNGCYEAQPVAIKWYHGTEQWQVLTLRFSDGTQVRTINQHGFFNADKNTYSYISSSNVESFIGDRFIKQQPDGTNAAVTLVSYGLTTENVGCYSLQTAFNDNFMVEDMLSITGEDYVGRFEYFDVGDDMKYDEAKMQADIDRYGLYSYGEFAGYLTEQQFCMFNGQYFKVLVGKGVMTKEDIIGIIEENLK